MNIEKIKNYNQKILALIGTVLLLMAFIGLISLGLFLMDEVRWKFRGANQDEGILSEKKIEELQKENKREQLVSFEFPRLVDTINHVYIIPVTQKTLEKSENIDDGVLGLMDSRASGKANYDPRYSKYYYGSFNNIIVHNSKKNTINQVFENRVSFNEIQTEYLDKEILLLFEVADKDTDKNGLINQRDLKTLYIYSISSGKMTNLEQEKTDIMNFNFIPESRDLIVQFGVDHNEDGKFDEDLEPAVVKRYNYESGELTNLIDYETNIRLQKILEGSI